MNTKTLYLDIDGVLLGRKSLKTFDVCLAKYAKEFLAFSLRNFNCYWLTTHCQDGDATKAIEWLKPYADAEFLRLAKQIKPTAWQTSKLDGIDFESDFYWVDDGPMQFEIKYLREGGFEDRWIHVDTWANPDDLQRVTEILKGDRKQRAATR